MSILLNAAIHIFYQSDMEFIFLDDVSCPDPILRAEYADDFDALHALYCLDTGADPAFISTRRVIDWMATYQPKTMAAHA